MRVHDFGGLVYPYLERIKAVSGLPIFRSCESCVCSKEPGYLLENRRSPSDRTAVKGNLLEGEVLFFFFFLNSSLSDYFPTRLSPPYSPPSPSPYPSPSL